MDFVVRPKLIKESVVWEVSLIDYFGDGLADGLIEVTEVWDLVAL